MANKHETLASLFTDTADAIREITGTNEKIIADNFPEVIREISVGIDTSDATIEPLEVMNGEVAYGAEGKIIGEAPFNFVKKEINSLNWVQTEMPVSQEWKSVIYANDKFVAVAGDGKSYQGKVIVE